MPPGGWRGGTVACSGLFEGRGGYMILGTKSPIAVPSLQPIARLLPGDSSGSAAVAAPPKVLVLGATGFVGSEICRRLSALGVPHIAASSSGQGATVPLDLTAPDCEARTEELCRTEGIRAVISAVGSINTPDDEAVNGGTARAAAGARAGGVERFVFIGNAPGARALSRSVPALRGYVAGKEASEAAIREAFGPDDYAIVQPSFIYGGPDLGLDPPRVTQELGQACEELLGLYPVRAVADVLPGPLGVLLAPPVSHERVARAAIHAALGLCRGKPELTGDDLVAAAARRPPRGFGGGAPAAAPAEEERAELKRRFFALRSAAAAAPDAAAQAEAVAIMEGLEELRPPASRPITDPALNGRWDFVFDTEGDLGTGLIKGLLESPSPVVQPVFDLKDVRMEVAGSETIRIVVATQALGRPCDLVLTTSFRPDASDPEGTMAWERFEGITLAGAELPVPDAWKRERPLEISYLDDDMLIARGNGGEPHVLLRDQGSP